MNLIRPVALILLALVLAACNLNSNITIDGDKPLKHLRLEDGRVGIRSPQGDMAWIDADGSLEIDRQPVALDAPQRALVLRFYTEAKGVQEEGVAIGKSGAAMAGKSVRSVVRGLTGGNPDAIGPEIESEARELEAHAMRLCARIGALQSAQDELAQALPAFAPFAVIKDTRTDACTKQIVDGHGTTSGDEAAATPSQD